MLRTCKQVSSGRQLASVDVYSVFTSGACAQFRQKCPLLSLPLAFLRFKRQQKHLNSLKTFSFKYFLLQRTKLKLDYRPRGLSTQQSH